YLTMTHKESGKRKLLVPAAPLDARCTSAFDGKGNLQIEEMMRNWNGPPNLRTILEYNLDPQGNLHAQSVEGTLFLAYLRLHERKYEEAFQLLTEVSEIDNHSKLLEEICNWILGYGEGHKQRNAIVHAFRLKVATLQSRMTNSPPQIISVYEDYLNQLSAVPSHFRLTRNEERALLAGMDGALAGRNAEIEKEALEPSISESKGYLVTPTLEKIDAWNKLGIYLWSVRCIEELQTDELKFTEVEQNSSEFFFRAWKVIIENQQEKKAELISALQKELAMRHFRKTSNHLFPNTEAINFLLFFALQESLEGAPEAAYPAGNEDSTLQQEVSGWFQEWLQYGKTLRCEKVVILRNRMQAAIEAPAEERGRHVEERKIAAAQVADQNAPTFATLAGKLEAATPLEIEVEALPVTPTNVKSPDEYSASIARELTAVQKDYDAGADLLRKRKTYAISAPDLTDLKRRTTTLRDTLKRSCSKLEKDILTLANKLPENREQRLHRELDLAQNRIRKLTIWDLEKLYMLRKGSAFTEANSALTPEDSEHLSQLMANWEVEQINLSRTHEALKKVGEIENCPQTDNGRELRKVLCAKLHAILSIDLSSFDEEERTNYLIFNRVTGKHPRSDQRANINKLAPLGEPCVLNMIMGAGKTAVIAPLWAKRTADSGKLPVLLVDGSQYDTVAHALKKSQKSCFGQEVCTISFLRQDLTQERLAQIDMKLAEIHESGSLLVMKPQMVQLLDLERFLALQTLSLQADEEMKEALQIRIQTLNSILKKFKQAAALGDEIDLLLRSDKEVTLPVGAVQHIAPEKVALGRTLLEHLVSNRIMIEGQTLRDYVGLAEKRQTQLTEEDWKKIIPLLAKELFQSQLLRLKKLPELEADFIKFVSGEPVDETSAFWLKVNQMHEAEDPADQMAAELISMAKHLCKQIIPAAFRQTGGRNFGRWRNLGQPEAKPGMAIPYLAADTPALTEFAYHYEALIKHFMLAAQVGVEECQVEYVAQMFEAMAYQQMQDSDEQFHETAEAISFFDMTGVQLLNIRNEGALKRATDQINSSRENRIAFETETANLYAAYHAARLTSTQQSLTNLFGQVSGMTGTPWNSGGYKPEMADNLHLDEGTQGAIIRSIIDRSEKTEVLPLDASNIEEELAKFYDETSGKFADGIFDSAAIFSKGGLTNRQVAEAILKFLNSKEHDGESLRQRAVLFFDKPEGGQQANQFTALIRIEGSDEYKVVALDSTDRGEIEKAGLNSPEEYVIFLPERQTTGTDIPMSLLANAYVTFDETMTLRTLLQTIMRERDFLNQQRTHFVFSPSLLAKMEATCGNTPSELIKQLLMMAIANEAREKADSQLRAYKQMFDEVFLQKMRDHLESENWDNLEEALRVYRPFLFPENSDQLFNQFFGNEEDVDTLEYLGILVESMIGKFENAVRLSGR
ncbi:MAG: DUF3638 domain-containing protein, partial [Chlamydiae bacterium]|nr:DUF3638 domain-containing protein [Chlamydiota bacterium]